MINNILFICVGNICRSPMAEGLFKQALPEKQVFSAGINAPIGQPADPLSVQLMAERGIDISEHRARKLASWMVYEADVIVTMDRCQMDFLEITYPRFKNKVCRLGELGNYDVPDPYLQGLTAFRQTCSLIDKGVGELITRIGHTGKESSRNDVAIIRDLS
ncbi:MAG: low molecular weight phosphotyrosine protein phosphatase [Glaciimonas sp.]|nr:low molecular weight phosphotyrosine protein phosphatase [Glaciimonas sp.]